MEYEIGDEDVLFDESTNPSLKANRRQSIHIQPPSPPTRRGDQTAVLIPEEEDQAA